MSLPNLSLIRQEERSSRAVLTRSRVIRGKLVWAWRPLSIAQRKRVESETKSEYLNAELLDRILEIRTLQGAIKRKEK